MLILCPYNHWIHLKDKHEVKQKAEEKLVQNIQKEAKVAKSKSGGKQVSPMLVVEKVVSMYQIRILGR